MDKVNDIINRALNLRANSKDKESKEADEKENATTGKWYTEEEPEIKLANKKDDYDFIRRDYTLRLLAEDDRKYLKGILSDMNLTIMLKAS